MKIKDVIRLAQNKVTINRVIIWNPNISRALFVGSFNDIPHILNNKIVKSYRYSKEKERMIIRI